MDYIHDAAGKIEQVTSVEVDRTLTKYDGDGQTLYQYKGGYDEETSEYSLNGYTAYFVRSSVLGGAVISEPNFQGGKRKTYVYAGGSVLAVQETGSPNNFVRWEHRDPSGTSFRNSDSENGNWSFQTLQEFDPMGANTGLSTPFSGGGAIPTEDLVSSLLYPNQPPAWSGQRVTYTLNGMPINADEARFLLDNGGARPSWLDTAQFLLGLELPFNSLGGGLYSVRFPSHRVDGVLHNLTLYGFLLQQNLTEYNTPQKSDH